MIVVAMYDEYKVIHLGYAERLEDVLNREAREYWELVQVLPQGENGRHLQIILRRPR